MKKVLVAMSGGVDSAVTALLLTRAGYECIGATMRLHESESSCCTSKDIEDARAVCTLLGIPHYVYDFSDRFREAVIDPFVTAYENGCTPNPCVSCNRHLKFRALFRAAEELGCSHIATGHYARTVWSDRHQRFLLKKAVDEKKDQSYMLYTLSGEQLAKTLFPLGELTKEEVRIIAENALPFCAKKPDSQDICFVKDSYIDFIESYRNTVYPPGNFVDRSGNVLGTHRGIIRYTVGQHKKLGLSTSVPLYVLAIDKEKNEVVLGEENELYTDTLTAKNVVFSAMDFPIAPIPVKAKIRYRHKEEAALLSPLEDGSVSLRFSRPQRAITPGQAVVFYNEDTLLGGGVIQ